MKQDGEYLLWITQMLIFLFFFQSIDIFVNELCWDKNNLSKCNKICALKLNNDKWQHVNMSLDLLSVHILWFELSEIIWHFASMLTTCSKHFLSNKPVSSIWLFLPLKHFIEHGHLMLDAQSIKDLPMLLNLLTKKLMNITKRPLNHLLISCQWVGFLLCTSCGETTNIVILLLVLNLKEKMTYFRKHWETGLQREVRNVQKKWYMKHSLMIVHVLTWRTQFKEQYLLLCRDSDAEQSTQLKKFKKGLHALLYELSDDEDETMNLGNNIPKDPNQPWLWHFRAFMDAVKQVPDGWSAVQ